jgi:hypothetical protein
MVEVKAPDMVAERFAFGCLTTQYKGTVLLFQEKVKD